jgi:hypothetical protein
MRSARHLVVVALVCAVGLAVLVLGLRLVQSHEPRLANLRSGAPSIANQLCAEDPQSCAAKTYFPSDGGP